MFDDFLKLTANYLLIQLAIIAFILPFYVLYIRKHATPGDNIGFNHRLELFFSSKYANWLVFFWAMSEALVWFVIPEFLLLLVIFMRISRKRQLLFYDIYGTACGTLLAFILHLPEHLIDKFAYVQPKMIEQVKYWYDHSGILALFHQPFSGVPYKVFTHIAPHYHFFILAFLLLAIAVRISRYFIFYAILTNIYPVFHKRVYRNYIPLFLIGTFIFSMLLLKVYDSFGLSYFVR